MRFWLHYQERSEGKLLTDTLWEFTKFCEFFGEEPVVESYLNSMGDSEDRWQDIGTTEGDKPLEGRIVYMVSEMNMEPYRQKYNLSIEGGSDTGADGDGE